VAANLGAHTNTTLAAGAHGGIAGLATNPAPGTGYLAYSNGVLTPFSVSGGDGSEPAFTNWLGTNTYLHGPMDENDPLALLVSGVRPMNGVLDMQNNAISNAYVAYGCNIFYSPAGNNVDFGVGNLDAAGTPTVLWAQRMLKAPGESDYELYWTTNRLEMGNGTVLYGNGGGLTNLAIYGTGSVQVTQTATGVVIGASGGGATDHGALTGLADNDHPQYVLTNGLPQSVTLSGGMATGAQFNAHGALTNVLFTTAPTAGASWPTAWGQTQTNLYQDSTNWWLRDIYAYGFRDRWSSNAVVATNWGYAR
jgi:hypothetical protein